MQTESGNITWRHLHLNLFCMTSRITLDFTLYDATQHGSFFFIFYFIFFAIVILFFLATIDKLRAISLGNSPRCNIIEWSEFRGKKKCLPFFIFRTSMSKEWCTPWDGSKQRGRTQQRHEHRDLSKKNEKRKWRAHGDTFQV